MKFLYLLTIILGLYACGGGGGGGNTDSDNDGIANSLDNCPSISNPDQLDTDLDSIGNVCDDDQDNDTVINASDNCPLQINPDQLDTDLDGIGNVCDDDNDNDGIADLNDVDRDGDGLIEVSSIEQLDWMRNDLFGQSRHDGATSNSTGCPVTTCNGYELTQDLNFDTNGDGIVDSNDDYFDYHGDVSNRGWLPIGNDASRYKANFNGNNFSILNLTINRDSTDTFTSGEYIGLFGYIDSAGLSGGLAIENLQIAKNNIVGHKYTGALIGYAEQNIGINNIVVDGDLAGFESTGGLIGFAFDNVIISNSSISGTVTGSYTFTGGLLGNSPTTVNISDSKVDAVVSGNTSVGGIVGIAEINSEISNVNVTSSVSGNLYTGGIVGIANLSVITNASTSGQVEATHYVGGLVGYARRQTVIRNSYTTGNVNGEGCVGGLVGSINYVLSASPMISTLVSSVSNSFAIGEVKGNKTSSISNCANNHVGGLVGIMYNANITSSFATGSATGNQFVGGLVGSSVTTSSTLNNFIEASYAIGEVVGTSTEGGLVGNSDQTEYINNYFATDTTQETNGIGSTVNATNTESSNIIGVTQVQMQCPIAVSSSSCVMGVTLYDNWNNYLNFDDNPVWEFGTSNQLPGLNLGGTIYRDNNLDGVID